MMKILYLDMWIGERIQEMKLAGIRRFAHMVGWEVIPVAEAESRPRKLRSLLKHHRPDGVVVECSAVRTDLPPRLFGKVPVVYLDSSRTLYGPGVARVSHDGKATMRAVFRELASNRPVAYAFVGYRLNRTWSTFRERAFKTLVKEAGGRCLGFARKLESESERHARLSAWLAELPKRSAVFAVNDMTALEVLSAAQAAGRSVPRDFTVIGVDNLERECEVSLPRLTSVQIDSEMAGYKAAAMLQRMLTGIPSERMDSYGPLLTVRRESTRGYGRREPKILDMIAFIRQLRYARPSARERAARF